MKAIDTTIVELRRLVSPVLPLASTDYFMPSLSALRVRANEGYLYADATDRFVAGVSRRPAPGAGSGFDELIRTKDLKTVLRVVVPPKGKDVAIRIHQADEVGSVLVEAGESRDLAATQFWFKSLGTTTPVDLWALLNNTLRADTGTESLPFGINPEKLAVFTAATNRDVNEGNLPLIVRAPRSGKGAVVVACGDHFLGLVMPMVTSPEANDAILTQWIGLIAPLKPGATA